MPEAEGMVRLMPHGYYDVVGEINALKARVDAIEDLLGALDANMTKLANATTQIASGLKLKAMDANERLKRLEERK